MISQPSNSWVKSNRSSGPAGHAKRLAADAHDPKSVVAAMSLRLDNSLMPLLHSVRRFPAGGDCDRGDAAGVRLTQFYADRTAR